MEALTRELIDAALACGGRYYLPYRLHATPEQFRAAYPQAERFFKLKRAVRFRRAVSESLLCAVRDVTEGKLNGGGRFSDTAPPGSPRWTDDWSAS